MADLCIIT